MFKPRKRIRKLFARLSTIPYRLRKGSQEHKHHFIHIPKNAGSTIREALRWRSDVSLSEPKHHRYIDIADVVGRDLSYFAVIRNPWSRTASRYRYGIQNSRRWPEDDARRLYIQNVSFAQYVKDQKIIDIPAFPGKPWMGPLSSWFNQLDWVRNEDGKVVCNCLRFEHLNSDVNAYFKSMLLLPKENVTATQNDYRELYDDELIQIVAECFREDIEYFGFDFEGTATRNVFVAG
ncbi:MAG TPA: sulfotransferase family 2 domain-containing protein [Woeseiaceae bacterium]|nr:sulfotransferase family 2 domain-containing protein [Woeseiaceae bacterium]